MKTKQIVIVEVEQGRVSYDLYEIREHDRYSHGEVIDDESAESVIERLNAYFGGQAIVARHVPLLAVGTLPPLNRS
ncbi:MAG: hypothetical protein ABI467_11760 [Kofleriaceae bacterium]